VPELDIAQYTAYLHGENGRVGWDDRLPEHVSVSQLQTFMKCPRQYQQEKVLGLATRTTEALFVGTAVHIGVENALRLKIDTGLDLESAKAVDKFTESWWPSALQAERELASEDVLWDTVEDPENPGTPFGEARAKHRASQMFGTYVRDVLPRLEPVAVEEEFLYPIPECPVPIRGRVDVRTKSGVIDLKTSANRKSKLEPSWMLQAAVYNAVTGLPVEFHAISCSERTNAVSIVTPLEVPGLLVSPSTSQYREYMRNVRALVAAIGSCMARYGTEEDWPTLGFAHTFACNYCSFREGCPVWEQDW